MRQRILNGQRFSFLLPTSAIELLNPINGCSMGFYAPVDAMRRKYRPELLKGEINISEKDVFVVSEAYLSITGWFIYTCLRHPSVVVKFHQKISDDDSEEFLELVKR